MKTYFTFTFDVPQSEQTFGNFSVMLTSLLVTTVCYVFCISYQIGNYVTEALIMPRTNRNQQFGRILLNLCDCYSGSVPFPSVLHYYRPQTKFGARYCFYTCLSVILFTGGCTPSLQTTPSHKTVTAAGILGMHSC